MSDEIKQNILSYSKKGPKSLWPSVSNYLIKLASSSNSEEALAFMYFFDSGGGSYPQVISDAQVKWFKKTSAEINPDLRLELWKIFILYFFL